MSYFSWTEDLDIHVDRLNEQHKKLIGIMEEIYTLNQQEVHKNSIEQAMDKLVVFASKHFVDEEEYMLSVSYQEAGTHKILHRELMQDLQSEVNQYKQLEESEVPDKFFSFLHRWIVVHIKGGDGRFSHFNAELRNNDAD